MPNKKLSQDSGRVNVMEVSLVMHKSIAKKLEPGSEGNLCCSCCRAACTSKVTLFQSNIVPK